MKSTYMVPLTFLGGAVGWQAVKSVLIPMIVWSSTAVGSAAYVHWVIKSHNANVERLEAGHSGALAVAERRLTAFADDLIGAVAIRESFVGAYRSDVPTNMFVKAKIDSMRAEDKRMLAEAEQLRTGSPGAFTSAMGASADQLKDLDAQLKVLSDQVAARNRS